MSKTSLVAHYEYRRHVLKPSFILAVLSLPLTIALFVGLTWLTGTVYESDDGAVGYVDHAGLLENPIPVPRRGSSPDSPSVPERVPLVPFPSEEAARQALDSGEILAYYVIDADYFDTNQVELAYLEPPDGDITRQFWDFMQINRLTDLPPELARRAVAGSDLVVRWPADGPTGGREFSQQMFMSQFVPLFVGVAFAFLLFMSSGYLMGAVAEEKGNRTIEILFTSISPTQLMGGKIASVVAVSLTQLLAWIICAVLIIWLGTGILNSDLLKSLSFDIGTVAPLIVLFVPAYVMFAALMAALGATFAETQDAQGIMGLFIILTMIPVWLLRLIGENPDGLLAIGLSMFPFTALSTSSIRLTFTSVPVWQTVVSTVILIGSAGFAAWLAGRAFRLGMLRYGQDLNWRQVFRREESEADQYEKNVAHRA